MDAKVDKLMKEELFLELCIRGVRVGYKKTTVREMKDQLRPLFEREARGEDSDYEDLIERSVADELALVELKIEEVVTALKDSEELANSVDKAGRVRALLSHLNRRTSRLYPLAEGDEVKSVRVLLAKLKACVEEFREIDEGSVFDASSVKTYSTKVESKKSDKKSVKKSDKKSDKANGKKKDDDGSDKDDSGKEDGSKPKSQKPIDVHKWGIKFSGSDSGTSVLSFLADVEEKAEWKGVDVNSLVAAASEFFEGDAKVWYRSMKKKIDSWNELKILMRKEFLPLNYYDTLWEEIRSRKQGVNEPIGTYVANMTGLFDWLELGEVVTEEMKLNLIRKNLAPFYLEKLALMHIHSLEELKSYGKHLEVNKQRVELYEGSKTKPKVLAPEFACKQPGRRPVVHALENNKPLTASSGGAKCWKCNAEGHSFSVCKEEQKWKFCYRCGKKDETTKSCPKCSKTPKGGKGPTHKQGE